MAQEPFERLQGMLTVRDFRDFRTELGFDLSEIPDSLADQTAASAAQLWLLKRKEDPAFTFDHALDMSVHEINAEMDRMVPGLTEALREAKAAAVKEAAKAAAEAAGIPWHDPDEGADAAPLTTSPAPASPGGNGAAPLVTAQPERSSSLTSV